MNPANEFAARSTQSLPPQTPGIRFTEYEFNRSDLSDQVISRLVKYIWASPGSLVGILCIPLALAGGGSASVVDGVLEVYGGLLARVLDGRVPVIGSCAA